MCVLKILSIFKKEKEKKKAKVISVYINVLYQKEKNKKEEPLVMLGNPFSIGWPK